MDLFTWRVMTKPALSRFSNALKTTALTFIHEVFLRRSRSRTTYTKLTVQRINVSGSLRKFHHGKIRPADWDDLRKIFVERSEMAKVPNGVETLPTISIVCVGRTNVTDRQTDG